MFQENRSGAESRGKQNKGSAINKKNAPFRNDAPYGVNFSAASGDNLKVELQPRSGLFETRLRWVRVGEYAGCDSTSIERQGGHWRKVKGAIGRGLLVLLAVEEADAAEDIEWLSGKIVRLRIFDDASGVMNLSVQETQGEILLISQFTLFASTKKGNRPSYIRSARPEIAVPLYEQFIARLTTDLGRPIQTGEFGADMKVTLTNDGPVTIIIDSKNRNIERGFCHCP